MMQLLDVNTEEYLPLKIIVCENKVGKIEFFAEEMKKELIAGFQNEEDFAYMKGYKPWKKLLAKY